MKTPGWAYAVGVLMMLLGTCRIAGNYVSRAMVREIKKQNELVKADNQGLDIQKNQRTSGHFADSTGAQLLHYNKKHPELAGGSILSNSFNLSDWQITWFLKLANCGFIVSFLYIVAGTSLLAGWRFSIVLSFIALGLYISFHLGKLVILLLGSGAGNLTAIFIGSLILGIITDIIFVIIISISDKSAYGFDSFTTQASLKI
jgi:hypothetical protein